MPPKLSPEQRVERFWSRVSKTNTCWLWTGAKNKDGYGNFWNCGKCIGAHIFAYGPVPPGCELHHRCKVKLCVRRNEKHVVALTRKQHRAEDRIFEKSVAVRISKTHCPYGHPYDQQNTRYYIRPGRHPMRRCMECDRIRHRKKAQ